VREKKDALEKKIIELSHKYKIITINNKNEYKIITINNKNE